MKNARYGVMRTFALGLPVVGCAMHLGVAQAMEIDTGNPDLSVRFDNTLRYNLGMRTEKQSDAILSSSSGNSDAQFDRGDIITNRLDLLTEIDVVYKEKMGFRVSGQTWYDHAYDGEEELGTGRTAAYPNQHFTSYTKRWNEGPSAEFLDAFVFGRFALGDTDSMLRVGQHNLYWGESLFSFVHGISYAQGPVDARKAFATPGTEAKELFLPLNQISLSTQLSDTLTVAGQYLLDWDYTRITDGGTYFAITDAMTYGGGTFAAPGVPWVGIFNEPEDKSGDWGLMARWSPEWMDGNVGIYYREYTDKMPQIVGNVTPTGRQAGFNFLDDRVELWGLSLSKNIAGISFGAEVSHRKGTGLLMGSRTTVGLEPVGDTWHGLVNALGYVGATPLFDAMSWSAEITYSKLDKVTKNPQNYNGVGYGCAAFKSLGCVTDEAAIGFAVKLEPKWYQVFNGVDLSMPLFYRTNDRTSPVLMGGYDGNGSYSIGLTAEHLNKYTYTLAYNDYFAEHENGIGQNGLYTVRSAGALGQHWDRGNVTFTFKTAF